MIRLLKFLYSGCFHVWEDAGDQYAWKDRWGVLQIKQPMRCKKCGERKFARG